ncbi:MAG: glycosyltransferase family 2 protein [Gammaproteobacteria bacterium]
MPTVSVIIPTFNRENLIKRALDSVYSQTLQPKEVIVIDDGSSDNTRLAVTDNFPNATYLFQPNAGVSAARNHGIRYACSEWLAFLDSDDEWAAEKLEKQLAVIDCKAGVKIIHTDEIWIRNGKRVNPMCKHRKPDGSIFEQCLPLCAISPSSVIIHRTLFDEIGLFDVNLPACEDYDMWLRICSRHPVHLVDEQLTIKYGGHGDQLSKKYWGMDRFRIASLMNIIESRTLTDKQSSAAIEVLMKKIDIYLTGAEKRNKWHEIEYYRNMKNKILAHSHADTDHQ